MAQAYDFALEKIGMDINSFSIWSDYIRFLKSVEAVGSYAENQRITAVRRIYQKGVITPLSHIEQLWKEYCIWEQALNPILAKKMQEERGRDYMNAKRVSKELEAITKGINRNAPSVPPQNIPEEQKQVELWKKYIIWEKNNPLRTEDKILCTKRVMFAYEQCLLCLSHYPNIWLDAAAYLEEASRLLIEKGDQQSGRTFSEEAALMYERAISGVLKKNTLLFCAYADFEENRNKHDKVHSIYKRLIDTPDCNPTLPYIMYMRFCRRAEGIKSARNVFKLAREDARISHHIFIVAADMEYFCNKDKSVAFKIFELGLKKFFSNPDYVRMYLDFMSHLNEDNNTRVLYERVLQQLDSSKSHEIWNKFLHFESTVGDMASMRKVEKRRAQVLQSEYEGRETALLVDRYKYLDLLPCDSQSLRCLGYTQQQDRSNHVVHSSIIADKSDTIKKEEGRAEKSYARPDLTCFIPFKPKRSHFGAAIHPPGVFSLPSSACDLLQRLPPPESFQGPFVVMEKFMEHMMMIPVPDGGVTNGETVTVNKVDPGTQLSIDIASGRKRKVVVKENDDSDEDTTTAPPTNDIYRSRHQKKAR
ncbi:DgyrCDS14090 [Dimorphilus gyrociliatus]|uniref:DgyrCDS14090 n=1 Tax=Dimorphilus gyrociliatus TaxID=2664684 RepID=A0A7I8WCJ8_9ANNE|nr:DgyrCDS14090 [Dimorphilus gyrociliatus]